MSKKPKKPIIESAPDFKFDTKVFTGARAKIWITDPETGEEHLLGIWNDFPKK